MDSQALQDASPFLKLPTEIRLIIYDHLFRSTRLRWGTRQNQHNVGDFLNINGSRVQLGSFQVRSCDPDGNDGWVDFRSYRWKPAAHSLAVLRACSQIYNEASHLWISRVLFMFDDSDAMQRKLGVRPRKAKHIQNLLLVVGASTNRYSVGHEIGNIEGLDLDNLILYGAHSNGGPRRFPDNLNEIYLKRAVGNAPPWKNLYFLAPESCFGMDSCWPSMWSEKFDSVIDEATVRYVSKAMANMLTASVKEIKGEDHVHAEIFCNLYYRNRRRRKDGNDADQVAGKTIKRLAILSCHHDPHVASAELKWEEGDDRAPLALPFVTKPRKRDRKVMEQSLVHDRYSRILDYDWDAEWGDPSANDDEESGDDWCNADLFD